MTTIKQRKMFENIYDLIKVCGLSDKQNDNWGQLSRKHGKEAKKELGQFIRNKNIEWNGNTNIISLGKHFRFKLLN